MAIQMIGIDHSVAAIDIRTIFSFTQKKIGDHKTGKRNLWLCPVIDL